MRIVQHRAIPEDDLLRRQWNDLVQQMEQPEVFYTYEWALAVGRAYHAQMVPLLLLAYEGDSLVGIVALATNKSGETCFLTSTTADYCDFICRPGLLEEFVYSVLAELKKLGAGMLRLANLPADSETSKALRSACRKNGYSLFARPAYSCARVVIDSPEKRERVRESAQRRNRRYAKTMGNMNSVTFSHCQSADEIGAELPSFAKAHVARFLATGRISNLAHLERRVFLEELAKLLGPSGWITLSQLKVGDRSVAWNYGFRFAGSWFWYQPTFTTSSQQYSPGLWLLSKIVEESCETESLNRIDLGLGAEGYKERLGTSSRETLYVTVASSSLRCLKERIRYRVATAIQSMPKLEALVRTVISRAAAFSVKFKRVGFVGSVKNLAHRTRQLLREQEEFYFLEFSRTPFPGTSSTAIRPIDLDLLAIAAMQYEEDPETLVYLLQAAARIGRSDEQGFVLVTDEGIPLNFCWVTDFEEFASEKLKHPMKAPASNCMLIVDCWTPPSIRGRGHYREAIAGVAAHLKAAGKSPWVSTSAANGKALRGAEGAGFVRVFSLLRKRSLFGSKTIESQFSTVTTLGVEVSSAA